MNALLRLDNISKFPIFREYGELGGVGEAIHSELSRRQVRRYTDNPPSHRMKNAGGDEVANGHGGKRTGAGRPRKSLADKIYEGSAKKHKPKVLNIPNLEDFPAPEVPDYLRHFNSTGISNSVPNMEAVYKETTDWLKNTGCLHLINPALITEYALLKCRWFEYEDIVCRAIVLQDEKTRLLHPSPMADMALKYRKAADAAWDKIWAIVTQNSEVYFGDDPNADIMAFLIKNKPTR